MSGDVRVYTHLLQRTCGANLLMSKELGQDKKRRANFGALCPARRAAVFFIRTERLSIVFSSLSELFSKNKVTFEGGNLVWQSVVNGTSIEFIFGTFVWEIIERGNYNVRSFLRSPLEDSPLSDFVAHIRTAFPDADLILRAPPPVNDEWVVPRNKHFEGPMGETRPLLRDTHDTWTSLERQFASHQRLDFLNYPKMVDELQVRCRCPSGL